MRSAPLLSELDSARMRQSLSLLFFVRRSVLALPGLRTKPSFLEVLLRHVTLELTQDRNGLLFGLGAGQDEPLGGFHYVLPGATTKP